MAAHNHGGLVICQVQKMVMAGSLHPKQVKVPGCIVDAVVVAPEQPQLYDLPSNRFLSGDYRQDFQGESEVMELNERKVIARRAIVELEPGDIGNLGVGIADGVSVISGEEGISEEFTLTVEGGTFGGVSLRGIYFGATANAKAILDMPSQFDFYDGGGLDICFLSFAEVDQQGNVNVHKFNGKTMGTGGFVDICQNSKKVVFLGTLTAGGLKVDVADEKLKIRQEGRFVKFVKSVPEITFHAGEAVRQGKTVLYVTERGVFRMTKEGLELFEIAPGIDLERDILAHMEFCPKVAEPLKVMEPMYFREEIMGIRESKFSKRKEELKMCIRDSLKGAGGKFQKIGGCLCQDCRFGATGGD